jgi:hypothetical protein
MVDVTPNCRHQSPDGGLLLVRQEEEVRLVPTRHNETVSLGQWEGIEKGCRQIVGGHEISAIHAVTEDAIHATTCSRLLPVQHEVPGSSPKLRDPEGLPPQQRPTSS